MISDSHTLLAGMSISIGALTLVETACVDPLLRSRPRTMGVGFGGFGELPAADDASVDNSSATDGSDSFLPPAAFIWEAIVQ